ncbi:HD domain-containing protein, partial [Myxococcota bacterium]|nr:HD domain-containing protein [Myxococcota bacterium]
TEAIVDPFEGRADLRAARLRAVDPESFGADPLRLLRVARLQAVFEAQVEGELAAICRGLDLAGVPVERIAGELRRTLLDSLYPARAFSWLAGIARLDVFPPIAALVGVPQDPVWHPEGDVFVHTLLVLDRARALANGLAAEQAEILMLAALGHDLGKPATTTREDGRIRSLGHESESARAAQAWLAELRFPQGVVNAVAALVEHHLAPPQFVSGGAGPRAYRRLARKLAAADVSLALLERLARADQLGRTTPEALAGRFEAGEVFLAAAEAAGVREAPRPDLVGARDLMARGIAPGPELGKLLRRCRELEDESGQRDPGPILERCLAERRGDAG